MIHNFDIEKYLSLVKNNYSNSNGFDYYFADIQKSIEFCKNSHSLEIFTFTEETDYEISGHVSLIKDNKSDNGTSFFGFFECIENEEVFFRLWNKLIDKAKKLDIKKLFGPINGCIWFQYRFISYTTDEIYFPSEPLTNKYYNEFFKKLENINEIEYHSAFRQKFDTIVKITETSFNLALNQSFKIEKIDKPTLEDLKQIYSISQIVFSQNWGFYDISFEDFLNLYSSDKIEKYISSIYLLLKNEKLIGFCTNISFGKTLIMKTIAVLPEFQSLGLGNALVYKVHFDAINQGVEKIIYALVRKTNKVKYFPTDDIQVFREYTAFELII
jgi:N-acetylglutamate synthase-like GNAT family acetyltransferase